jgi:uroporphyrinogen decarboxylase
MALSLSLSVYEHAAALIGRHPWDVSRDGDLLYRAHAAAYELYRHFPLTVGIDIYNLEAEAYGCRVECPDRSGIPAIVRPLCAAVEQALTLPPFDPGSAGRVPMAIAAGRRLKQCFPEADVRLPVSGPFSIAQSLLGLEPLLAEVASRPALVRDLLARLAQAQVSLARAAHAAGLGVAFFESAAAPPLLSPAQFRAVELPALKAAISGVSAVVGRAVPCIIGGDTAAIVPAMLETGTDFLICPAETDRVAFLAAAAVRPAVKVRINLDPAVYSRGSHADIAAAVAEVAALAAGRPNVLLGSGAIPYETPPEHVLFLKRCAEGAAG